MVTNQFNMVTIRHKASNAFVARVFCPAAEQEKTINDAVERHCSFYRIKPAFTAAECQVIVEQKADESRASKADNVDDVKERAEALRKREEALLQRELATQERRKALELREAALKLRTEKLASGTSATAANVPSDGEARAEPTEAEPATKESAAAVLGSSTALSASQLAKITSKFPKSASKVSGDASVQLVPHADGEWVQQKWADMKPIAIGVKQSLALGRNETTGIMYAKLGREQARIERTATQLLVTRLGKNPSWVLRGGYVQSLEKDEAFALEAGDVLLLLKAKFPYEVVVKSDEATKNGDAKAPQKKSGGEKKNGGEKHHHHHHHHHHQEKKSEKEEAKKSEGGGGGGGGKGKKSGKKKK